VRSLLKDFVAIVCSVEVTLPYIRIYVKFLMLFMVVPAPSSHLSVVQN